MIAAVPSAVGFMMRLRAAGERGMSAPVRLVFMPRKLSVPNIELSTYGPISPAISSISPAGASSSTMA